MNTCSTIVVKYSCIGKVIDEINENYGTVLNMTCLRDNKKYKLNVNWKNDTIPKHIAVYTKDRDNHFYIDSVTIHSS